MIAGVRCMAEPVAVPLNRTKLKDSGNVLIERKLFTIFGLEKIEEYLERMAAKGWHLYNTRGLGYTYTFTRGEPARVRYFVDFGWTDVSQLLTRSTPRSGLTCLAYDGPRPESRNALLSQMVLYRYLQVMFGIFVAPIFGNIAFCLINIFSIVIAIFNLNHIDSTHPFALTLLTVIACSVIGLMLCLTIGALLFWLVLIVLLGVKHSRLKKKLSSVA